MTVHEKCHEPLETPQPLATQRQRNRFFNGKFLCEDDLTDEQTYFRSRSQFRTRHLHGWGIACGLDVDNVAEDGCKAHYLTVSKGVAFDLFGREVIQSTDRLRVCIPPPEWWAKDESNSEYPCESADDVDIRVKPDGKNDRPYLDVDHEYLLCLRYGERQTDRTRAYCGGPGVGTSKQEFNRVDEVTQIVLLSSAETEVMVEAGYWPKGDDPSRPHASNNSCESPFPDCKSVVKEGLVPLAMILPKKQQEEEEGDGTKHEDGEPLFSIVTCGRTYIPDPSGRNLTRIIGVNWEHDGLYTHRLIKKQLGNVEDGYQLKIMFNNPLIDQEPEDGDAGGPRSPQDYSINEMTFEVQFATTANAYERLEGVATLADDKKTALFKINDIHRLQSGVTVFIRLRCDFVLDCNGQAVDGNNIAGRVVCLLENDGSKSDQNDRSHQSGNGSPGGTFESWFRIVDPDVHPDTNAQKDPVAEHSDS